MGMYTELVFGCNLKKNTPKEVIEAIEYMTGQRQYDDTVEPELNIINLNHELFDCRRWSWMLNSDSEYFEGVSTSRIIEDNCFHDYRLSIRCNLKNYDNEIDKFINWIEPYIDCCGNELLGYKRYEENEFPTLYYSEIGWVSFEPSDKEGYDWDTYNYHY